MKAEPDARSDAHAAIILALVSLIVLHAIWQGWLVVAAPYPAHYDFDEGVYAQTAAASLAGGRLYKAIFLSQPPFYIGVLAHAFGAFGRSLRSARGTAVGFSVLWLAGLAAIAARAAGMRAAVWAVAIAASASAFILASHTVQMEGPGEAVAALAVATGFAAAARVRAGAHSTAAAWWAAAGLAAGVAATTKFTALTCLLPLAVALTMSGARVSGRTTAMHGALFAAAAALGAGAAILWSGGLSTEIWRQTVTFHGAVAGVNPFDPGRSGSLLAAFGAANWFITMLGLVGLVSAVLPVRVGRSESNSVAPTHAATVVPRRALVVWLIADLAALLLWRPVWPHHLVIFITPLAALGAAAVEIVLEFGNRPGVECGGRACAPPLRRWRPRVTACVLVAAWLVGAGAALAAARPEGSETLRAAAAEIRWAVPSAARVVADDPFIAFLAGRDAPEALCDTSEMRLRAGWLTVATLRAAIRDPRVRGIVLWRGTFRQMVPAFVDDALDHFPQRWTFGADRQILAR